MVSRHHLAKTDMDCTQIDADVSQKMLASRQLMRMCQNKKGGVFDEGVDGHIEQVDSVFLTSCQHGDRYAWSDYGVCCSGMLVAMTDRDEENLLPRDV